MTNDSLDAVQPPELSDQERARVRAEVRYAMMVLEESRPSPDVKHESGIEKVLGYLSNGFVLLLVGALITSVLVPGFQRSYENRKQQLNLMQECLGQFLLYSNSIWQEYYAILPLTQELEIDKDEYLKYLKEIAQIKLKRYDAFAKVQALAVAYRHNSDAGNSPVETALKNYAIQLNTASAGIDKWLKGLYCTPVNREESPCNQFDPTFDAFTEYEKIKELVVKIGNRESDNAAAFMVLEINELYKGGAYAAR